MQYPAHQSYRARRPRVAWPDLIGSLLLLTLVVLAALAAILITRWTLHK
jgi:hypothetical protein